MEMPVVVGVLVAIIFLVSFSEWFYGISSGLKSLVLDDVFYTYRLIGVSLVSIVFMAGVFLAIATMNECPNEQREGIFAGLRCEEYLSIKTVTQKFLETNNQTVDQSL